MAPDRSNTSDLCLACGLCCNGVLFKDVELQPADDAIKLAALGLPLKITRDGNQTLAKAPQPCAALCADNRCRIYEDRPQRCRQFECSLFKSVAAGEMAFDKALKTIGTTRQRAEKVRRLLQELGDTDEHVALSLRFQRTRRRIEKKGFDDASADTFGELTLAVHALNLLLSSKFYPA